MQHSSDGTLPVRFKTSPSTGLNLHFDMQVNERLGLYNSLLLREYCSILPHGTMRDMVRLIVKVWAKPRGFNSPSPGTSKKGAVHDRIPNRGITFSSYALTLMCISYFQVGYVVFPRMSIADPSYRIRDICQICKRT